jgi:hypothetical protein
MLALIALLTFVSVVTEMRIALKVTWVGDLLARHPFLGVAFSIGLSFMIGALFGMHGLIAGTSAILTSIITYPIHWVRGLNKESAQRQVSRTTILQERKRQKSHA